MHVSERTWLTNRIARLRTPSIASSSEDHRSWKIYTENICNFVYKEPTLWPPVQYGLLLVAPYALRSAFLEDPSWLRVASAYIMHGDSQWHYISLNLWVCHGNLGSPVFQSRYHSRILGNCNTRTLRHVCGVWRKLPSSATALSFPCFSALFFHITLKELTRTAELSLPHLPFWYQQFFHCPLRQVYRKASVSTGNPMVIKWSLISENNNRWLSRVYWPRCLVLPNARFEKHWSSRGAHSKWQPHQFPAWLRTSFNAVSSLCFRFLFQAARRACGLCRPVTIDIHDSRLPLYNSMTG